MYENKCFLSVSSRSQTFLFMLDWHNLSTPRNHFLVLLPLFAQCHKFESSLSFLSQVQASGLHPEFLGPVSTNLLTRLSFVAHCF